MDNTKKDKGVKSPPTAKSVEVTKRFNELELLRIKTDTKVPAATPTLSVDGVPVLDLEDLAAIKAKQKQGKTTALKVMVGAWMSGQLFRLKSELEHPVVLWLDTEQKESDVKLILDDIKQMTGVKNSYLDKHLFLFHLRKLNYKTLLSDTQVLISQYHPQVVIIDGVVEFVDSFNDELHSHELIDELLSISEDYHCCILNVLHENKGQDDRNMRGHLGTMLAQKVGTVLQCKKENDIITVSCTDPRHQAMPPWRIRYDDNGNIVDADELKQVKLTAAEEKKKSQIEAIHQAIRDNGGSITRGELNQKLATILNLNRTTIANLITKELKSSLVEVDGKIEIAPQLPFDVQ